MKPYIHTWLPEIVLMVALTSGCGGVSPAVREAYAIEQARCLANEREIIARQGTTEAQDEEDFAAERARCDAALQAIEHGTSTDGGTP
jgi:hypothetical protein